MRLKKIKREDEVFLANIPYRDEMFNDGKYGNRVNGSHCSIPDCLTIYK